LARDVRRTQNPTSTPIVTAAAASAGYTLFYLFFNLECSDVFIRR
jgi:hypothetical protein